MENKRKKIVILGGSKYIVPVIKEAHGLGLFVITCDYLPDNYAHKYSDEYVNLSVVDKDAVLEYCKSNNVDGIISFACDPGVVTAAFVAEKLGLPNCGPYKSVEILQNKALFRSFLRSNNFNVPDFYFFKSYNDVLKDKEKLKFPLIIKPVDSAGSKGVNKVNSFDDLKNFVDIALSYSKTHSFILEEFIEKSGCSSDCDSLSIDGDMVVTTFSSQYFDETCENQYVPSGYYWPSSFKNDETLYLKQEIQRLITLLGMQTSIYNIETRIGKDGKPYIMELSPRGGGNRLSEMVERVYGVNLIRCLLQYSVGLPIDTPKKFNKENNVVEIILHSNRSGIFHSVSIDKEFQKYLVEDDIWIKEGDQVDSFKGANNAFGTMVFLFPNQNLMELFLKNQNDIVKVLLK